MNAIDYEFEDNVGGDRSAAERSVAGDVEALRPLPAFPSTPSALARACTPSCSSVRVTAAWHG